MKLLNSGVASFYVISKSNSSGIAHGNPTPAWFSCSRTHIACDVFSCSDCGCTGVSLSDRTGHGDKRGQVFYRNTNRVRSLLQGKGHGVSASMAHCLSNVLNCFIQLSKNTKEENRLSYIPRWKRAEA